MRQLKSVWPLCVLSLLFVWAISAGKSAAAERQRIEDSLSALGQERDRLLYENVILSHDYTRLSAIVQYSTDYRIDAGQAAMIYDIALAEGIDTDIAFRLVEVESAFNSRAVSRVGAIGYAQVMPSTAAELMERRVPVDELFDPELNLHLGFRYLKQLLTEYNGDLRLALLSYNRGPHRVSQLLAIGEDPENGYAESICGSCGVSE